MYDNGYSTKGVRVLAVEEVERGLSVTVTSNAFAVSRCTLHRWLERVPEDGSSGLERRCGSGRPRKLEELSEGELRDIFLRPASSFGFEIDSIEVISFLAQMLRHHPRRHLVVVMDQAKPHTSKKTKDYIESEPRLHALYLPAYSPDWNPDEKVWNHLKHHEVKSHQAKDKSELKLLASRKLRSMANRFALLRG